MMLSISEIKADQAQLPTFLNEFVDSNSIRYITINDRKKVVISDNICALLASRIHERFGHIGYTHMLTMLQPLYYAKNIYKIIKKITSECTICVKNKTRTSRKRGSLGHLGPASKPYEVMSLDTIGGFGDKSSSKRYIHLLVDHFTRYAFISTSATQNANDFIRLVARVQKSDKIGLLLTDQFGGLTSSKFENYLNSQGITRILTATDAPFSNGLNERLNQTLVNRIRCHMNSSQNKTSWPISALRCTEEYNDTVHSVTKFSPRYLLYGKYPDVIPPELLPNRDLNQNRVTAFQNSIRNHDANKIRYDKTKMNASFSVGDKVFIENGNKLNRDKLDPIRIGPFPIIEKKSDHVFLVQCGPSLRKKRLYHISKMVPFISQDDKK
jgi:hypothetical protein